MVAAARTILVENGVVKAIRGDSDHYRPTAMQMGNAIRAIRSYGVDISKMVVLSWDPSDKVEQAVGSIGGMGLRRRSPHVAAGRVADRRHRARNLWEDAGLHPGNGRLHQDAGRLRIGAEHLCDMSQITNPYSTTAERMVMRNGVPASVYLKTA